MFYNTKRFGIINFYTNRELVLLSNKIKQMDLKGMYEIKDNVLYVKIGVV